MATPVAIWSEVSASGYRQSTLVSSSVANPNVAWSRALRESGTAQSFARLERLCATRLRPAGAGRGGERVGQVLEVADLRYRVGDAEATGTLPLRQVGGAEDAVDDRQADRGA